MVFCNKGFGQQLKESYIVTILILIDGFLQYKEQTMLDNIKNNVTILILIDGFLQ